MNIRLFLKKADRVKHCVLLLLAFFMVSSLCQAEALLYAEPTHMANSSLLLDVTRGGDDVYAAGERGHIIRSSDCGVTWQQMPVPTRKTLNTIFFEDDKKGWAGGHDGLILMTEDRGEHWQIVNEDMAAEQPIFDLIVTRAGRGLAVGAYGALLVSDDGGKSWSQKLIYGEDDFHLYSIIEMRSGELVVSGEAGNVYLSINNGNSWEKLKTPYEGTFFGSLLLDDERLIIFGMRGHIYRSSDLGYTWERVASATDFTLSGAIELQDKTIMISGDAGVLLQSKDQGQSFTALPAARRTHKSAMVECVDGGVLAVGEAGVEKVR